LLFIVAIKYIDAFLFRFSFCSVSFNTRHGSYHIVELPDTQTFKKITMIEVNDLHKKFGKVKVLNGIHLEYHPGKIYGLVGREWCRKDYFIQLHDGNL